MNVKRYSNSVQTTLTPENWLAADENAPQTPPWIYTLSVQCRNIVETTIDVLFNPNTSALVDALSSYRICGYELTSTELKLYAWGEKPSIELPCVIITRGGIYDAS